MSNLAKVCLMLLGLMFGSHALAAEPSGKPATDGGLDIARAAFQRGVELFHEGNFEAALAEFQKANRVGPSYRILYNIAQTYYELHDYVAALRNYKQYLTDGESELPAARRTQVEETIQKLQSRIATIVISVSVEGAQVSVDDVVVGVSPLTAPVTVNPGLRRVAAARAGMPTVSRSITTAGGDQSEVTLDLRGAGRTPVYPASGTSSPPLTVPAKAAQHSHVPLIVGLTVTGACAVTTGVFGWLALRGQNKYDRDLDTFGISHTQVSDDRSRMRNYALVADIAAAATLAAGGVSLYLALTSPGGDAPQAAQPRPRLAVTPTLNGLALFGGW
jgi:hypothetical protein